MQNSHRLRIGREWRPRGRVSARPVEHCCINRARSIDVYAQRSRGQPPIKSESRVTA
ncbi:MAG: hypothetical protein V3Q69_11730 [Burkholderia sp.]